MSILLLQKCALGTRAESLLCWTLCSQGSPGWQWFRNQVSSQNGKDQTLSKARESLSSQPQTESRLDLLHVPGHCSRVALSTSSGMATETALQASLGPVPLSSLDVASMPKLCFWEGPRIPHHFIYPQTTKLSQINMQYKQNNLNHTNLSKTSSSTGGLLC